MATRKLKIGIVHYRVGKTDGVSLEISKRQSVLEELGHDVRLISGTRSNGSDYCIPELEYDQEPMVTIKRNAFFALEDYPSVHELMREVRQVVAKIEHQFQAIHDTEQFDCLFLHNIFSHVLHLPAAEAFHHLLRRQQLPAFGVHHDFYWDGTNAQTYQPTSEVIEDFITKHLPPHLPNLRHIVINSLNQQRLQKEHGLAADVVPDMFNFDQEPWTIDDYNQSLPTDGGFKENDLVVLQATRVVERKAIELAIDLTAELSKRQAELVGQTLYNGKQLTADSNVVLMLAGYAEGFALPYRTKLEEEIQRQGIIAHFVDHCVDTERRTESGKKYYSLWDTYAHADLVTYPSIWEGWGNQFIEAVFAKKPIAVFEYPVFKNDIAPEGYQVISLGDALGPDRDNRLVTIPDKHLQAAAQQTIDTLLSQKTPQAL